MWRNCSRASRGRGARTLASSEFADLIWRWRPASALWLARAADATGDGSGTRLAETRHARRLGAPNRWSEPWMRPLSYSAIGRPGSFSLRAPGRFNHPSIKLKGAMSGALTSNHRLTGARGAPT